MVKEKKKENVDYFPKSFTLRTFNIWVSKWIDRYNWGDLKEYHYTMDWINTAQYKSYIKLREKPHSNPHYRDTCLQDHLNGRVDTDGFVYATANPFNDKIMLCGDIDDIDGYGYDDCLEAVLYLKSRFFPDLYFEPSTSGNGIHFYIIIDFSSFPNSNNYNSFNRYNCNNTISNISHIFTTLIDGMFNCHFDGFCGNYGIYSLKKHNVKLLERGSMMKLPCPQSYIDFSILLSLHHYSHSELDAIIQEIYQLNQSSSPVEQVNTTALSSTPYNYLGSTFGKQPISRANISLYKPIDRYRLSVQDLKRTLGRSPGYDEWNEYYESIGWNTGEATDTREPLFEVVLAYVEKGYDESKVGVADYHRAGKYAYLTTDITKEYLNTLNKNKRDKVNRIDIEMGIGYVGWVLCSQGVKNVDNDDYIFTVEQNGLVDYMNKKVEKNEGSRKGHKSRAGRIFKALIDYGYILKVDEYRATWYKEANAGVPATVGRTGRCRRYLLTAKHPQYNKFLNVYGVHTVAAWVNGEMTAIPVS